MFSWWRDWRHARILGRHRIDPGTWSPVVSSSTAAAHLSGPERDRLRDLVTLFLYDKSIEPGAGMELTDPMRLRIACEACIPILNLGLGLYSNWYSVVVYPGEFVTRHEYTDETGVAHTDDEAKTGEAWDRGPVVISWDDVIRPEPGQNVIIHEMAHKLDLLDGAANGRPPLHAGMDQRLWTETFSSAYTRQVKAVEAGRETAVDPYAADDPGEFFAVVSEAFFETPALLYEEWRPVYEQLALFYRQRPLGA